MIACGGRPLAVVTALLLTGCTTMRAPLPELDPAVRDAAQRSCASTEHIDPSARLNRAEPARQVATAGRHAAPAARPAAVFSARATEMARIIGVLPLLSDVPDLRGQPAPDRDTELAALRVRQRITEQILLAMLEVASVHALIDCEEERGAQLRDHLQKIEDRRARRLGLTSILIGAATAILSGGVGLARADSVAADVIGTVGGSAEAAAGLSLMYGSARGELRTEPNVLREVWDGPEQPTLLPAAVWRFLNRPAEGDASGRTVRQAIVAEWRGGERLGRTGSAEERAHLALLLGSGGWFAVDELLTRDAMLDILRAQVSRMSQDLERLLRELIARSRTDDR